MKASIHPQYFQATVTCVCGNTFTVGSTKPKIDVEICSKCHPFFTGEMRFVDTMGRVEKFKQKQATGAGYQSKKKQSDTAVKQQKTLKEMLEEAKQKA
jgi:large subunit ribosomal protein L31